ncbi:MAG: hypothetical protein IT481_10785 [Gammaproteobacteria bacterium]|nr:hypothetical protein [Gammaproteobacteria bacterium]
MLAAPPQDLRGAAAETALNLEGFGFHSRLTPGVGGFLTTRIFPVMLFRDGAALLDVAALATAEGLEVHRRTNPRA